MPLDPTKNFAKATVTTGYDASATSIALTSGHGAKLPDPATDGAFNLVWWNATDYGDPSDDPNVEIVRCTARSTDTLTVTRAQEGTSASTKNTSGKTYKMILALTKKMIDDIEDNREVANETPAGTINGSNVTFTLANTPLPASSLKLYLNGVRQKAGGEDFTLSGATITFVNAPLTGSILLADYTK
jgi:hypothetical protein